MKKFWIVITLMLAMIAVPDNADAQRRKRCGNHHPRNGQPVGAPLDGGLLTILGAAGVVYYVARKKKKQVE